ncbi:RagB/SusD family nutrient uptake outer membrane protein [Hufsiella ginkgonis]|uniref:RagB/SusD family nutrient uptake outer membrane protein n=1 Tax=Hufsiella ginkgonis TaxID=2695274 RepID=A0A7K1XVD6_9SPHI|nr:RagB/SusD family nutrient uptake outer membrane protein [Hufsiella ginkgonis]MXV14476.1 RagB/SusD family nutrient uptake outer membrane protein [Hufsiella ginkgonis]
MKTPIFKRYTGTLLIAIAMMGITACQKYLEVSPISSFGPDYTFNSVTNAQKAVLGAYAALTGDAGYGIRLSMYYPYDNDEMMGQGATPYPDGERRDIAHYNTQPSNSQLAGPFNQLYHGIEMANLCIYYIPKMEQYTSGSASDQKALKRLYGEALALRAQFYFEVIRNWGDVPASFQPSSFESDLFKARTNRDTIYNRVLADLATASNLVPWKTEDPSVTNERINQGGVRALRARIALFRGGFSLRQSKTMERPADYKTYYQIAKDECAAIMARNDHRLNASYQAVFKDALDAHAKDPAGEIIWEVGMTGGSSGVGDSKLGYYNGPRLNGATGNGALTILPSYFYSFDPNDTRRDVTCAPYNISSAGIIQPRTLVTMVDGKFRRDWISNPSVLTSTAQYFGINWPVIRYSDVLLMFAEADNELAGAPSAAAKAAFEQVRTRGFGGNATLIGTTPADKTGFFNAIVKERAFEFGAEGIRKYDLIRWNLLKTKLDEAKAQMAEMAKPVADRILPYKNYPLNMYFQANATSVVPLNSYYQPEPATAPANSVTVAWVTAPTVSGTTTTPSTITSTLLTYFAINFTPNKSELLPLPQQTVEANPILGGQWYGY